VTQGLVAELTGGRALARSALWNIVGQGAPLIAALITIPVVLRGLGTERFGALSLAWLLIGYFSVFDLGLGRALTMLVAEKLAARREEEIPALTWTALLLMLGLGVAGALLIAWPSDWLLSRALNVSPSLRDEMRMALRVLAACLPFVITTAGLRGLLEARQMFAAVNAVRIPMGVLTFAGPTLVLPFSRSLVPVVAVLALVRLATWAVHVALCLHAFPGLRGGPRPRAALLAPLLRLGGWMTVTNVVGPLMVYLDRFLIAGLVTLSAVAYYATPYEIVTKLLLVPTAVAQVLFPAFSASIVADRPRTALLFDRGLKSVFLVLFPATLVLVTLAPELLRLWLGREFAIESSGVLRWLAVGVFINGLAQVPFALVQGVGRPDYTAGLHLLELPFYLVAVWWLIHARGVEGAAIAWTARAGVDAVVLLGAAGRMVVPLPSARWRLAAIATALAICGLGALVDDPLAKGLFLTLALAAFVALAWTLVLTAEERHLAWRHLAPAALLPRARP
jgi:O-antigen/teichoic acid export membrane protein